tara:strand:+ start:301 stop:1101 length:801 start_codon:yes stop_codon:yes gene_type:complete
MISKVYKLHVKILVIQNKMGIGDTVIYLPFIKAISKKFNCQVSLLVKASSKADEFLNKTNYIDQVIYQKKNDGILGSIKLAGELGKYKFEKVFIFNSSIRFNLVSRLAGIKKIYQYPLFKKKRQHIIRAAKKLIKDNLSIDVNENPEIQISENLIKETYDKLNIKEDEINILLAIGGSGPTKRIPSKTFLEFMKKTKNMKKCRFFLATGKEEDEQKILNEILDTEFKDQCVALDNHSIYETLPIIKNCNIAICKIQVFHIYHQHLV